MSIEGADALLTGWGRTAPTRALVVRPTSAADVITMFEAAGARGVIARGLGRSYGDIAQNAGGRVLDMTGLTGVCDLDPRTARLRVSAGAGVDKLLRFLVPQGWFLPVTPGTRFVTVGGAIANDIHGKNHHADGSFCEHVVSMELLTPGGGIQTVGPQTGGDVFQATAGGLGLTGVVTDAILTLLPIETSRVRVDTERAADIDDLMARMEEGDHRYRYSVAWIDCLARGRSLGRSVLRRADHATVDELTPRGRARPLAYAARPLGSIPPGVPPLIRPATVRAFNELWFRRAPRVERGRLELIASYFHPLDSIANWNRLYGPRGFVQYQFVVPLGEERTVRNALERLSAAGSASFLAVLKRFGGGHGFLSFPMPGWTLALDIPAREPGLPSLLDALDRSVADAGGRVYLAKDSRLRPELLPEMYPELDRWRAVRERLDPDHVLQSDLGRRLGLLAAERRSAA